MATKICNICNTEKPIDSFGKSKTCKDGHRGQCKKCLCEKQQKRMTPTKKKEKAIYDKKYRERPERIKAAKERQIKRRKYGDKDEAAKKARKFQEFSDLSKEEYEKVFKEKNKVFLNKKQREYRRKGRRRLDIEKSQRDKLSDCYIKGLITRGKFSTSFIPKEMIEAKRALVKAKRMVKEYEKDESSN